MTISTDFTKKTAGQIAATIDARGAVYAPPEDNFKRIADAWRLWLNWRHGVDVPMNAFDAGMMQSIIKLARQAETPHHQDTALDGPAYWMLAVGCDHDLRVAQQCEAPPPVGYAARQLAAYSVFLDRLGPNHRIVGESDAERLARLRTGKAHPSRSCVEDFVETENGWHWREVAAK